MSERFFRDGWDVLILENFIRGISETNPIGSTASCLDYGRLFTRVTKKRAEPGAEKYSRPEFVSSTSVKNVIDIFSLLV